MNFLIVGVGLIAQEYAKVLKELGVSFTLVGRDPKKTQAVKDHLHCEVFSGGVQNFLEATSMKFDGAINAVDTENLYPVNLALIQSGKVRQVLTEKPGAFTETEFKHLAEASEKVSCPLYIAYNRRNFSSVLKLKEILSKERNTSLFFEFTEWFWRINPSEYSAKTIKEWILCNSSHVLDLVFFLGDGVREIKSSSVRSTSEAINNTQYVGHGLMNNGSLFSYIADWESAGRWKVEASTANGRYMLCPLEKLFFQKRGTLEYVEIPLETTLDEKFKPGFYKQVAALKEKNPGLKTIQDQVRDFSFYKKIQGE
jgi:predicted dehydrogenase